MAGKPRQERVDVHSMRVIKKMIDNPHLTTNPLTITETLALTMKYSGSTLREMQESLSLSQTGLYSQLDSGMEKVTNYLKRTTPMKQA